MHSSLVVRRPINSPCMLCLLRASAAADQSIPHIARRRRLNRRVHSSSNRNQRAAQNFSRNPEPEDVSQYERSSSYQQPAPAQFQGFLGGRTSTAASLKWGVKKSSPLSPNSPPSQAPESHSSQSQASPSMSQVNPSAQQTEPPRITRNATRNAISQRSPIAPESFQHKNNQTHGTTSTANRWSSQILSTPKSGESPSDLRLHDVRRALGASQPQPDQGSPRSFASPNSSFSQPKAPRADLAKWGIGTPKKSIFAADASSVLDRLSSTQEPPPHRSPTFRTAPPAAETKTWDELEKKYGELQKQDPSFRSGRGGSEEAAMDPVEEALQQAKKLSKKKQRGKVDPEDWDRKLSFRAKDKSKYGREFVFDEMDAEEEVESKAAKRERKKLEREQKAKEKAEQQQFPPILIPEFVNVRNLARLCKIQLEAFTDKMTELGFTETNPDYVLNAEMAGLIAMEYGFEPIVDKSHERDLFALPVPANKSRLPSRPPVVTIMGHVDHGKTTILDWLRKSSIVEQEHGGITQHIGAFSVTMPSGRNITFLDTPGHEAFLNMRERGANMTDIVILVVAADDSIMPQTIEAIKHAKAAKVPIIVAVNKCDKEDADPERVKSDLAQWDIQIEDVGGDTQVVCVSGKTGLGMEDLEEAVLLQADDLDVRAAKTGRVEGWVVETTTKTRGRVATVLVRRGILRKGDVIVAGNTWARVRNLVTENGLELEEAPPGTPVEIDGWRDQPDAGDEVLQAASEDKAKSVVEYRLFKAERQQLAKDIEAINEQRRLHQIKKDREAKIKELEEQGVENPELEVQPLEEDDKFKILEVPFIVKADVAGSVEAVVAQVLSVANDEVRTKIIKSGVGPLTESDIMMAQSTGAYCLTFNVTDDPDILAYGRHSGVKMLHHDVIYAILDDIKALMSEKLKPTIIRTVIGEAEIAKVFEYNVKKRITKPFAGCRVYRGVIRQSAKAKILRNGEMVFEGDIETLKNVKRNVPEMSQGTECGMGFVKFDDFKEGDIIHCYTETKKQRKFD